MTTDVHVVSHTHWDREWYLTREQYRLRLVGLIDRVLERLESDPRFAFFHLDGQTIVLEDYLEVRPDAEQRLRRQIQGGRLLVGPWYVMPDMALVSGEALVRNLAQGHRIAARFGAVMRVGYMPDPFGHVAQMPQILAGFGLDSALLWRGFGGERAEYWWQAPDGTRVLLLHLPRAGYCNALRLPLLPAAQMRALGSEVVSGERGRSAFGVVLLMAGVDHVEPHPGLLELPARLSETPGVSARLSTLPAYVDAVRAAMAAEGAPALESVGGELRAGESYANLLPGVLSTRSYLKQANVRVQTCLEREAEPLAAFAWLVGEPYPDGLLGYAWKTLLQNHPHDSICGCSVDAVHEENLTRFARAGQTAEALAEQALAALARRVAAPAPGAVRCLVTHTDASEYTGVVIGELDLPIASVEPGRQVDQTLLEAPIRLFPAGAAVASLRNADGASLPFQVLGADEHVVHLMSRHEPPWAVRARRLRLAVWVERLPSCGYSALDVWLDPPATPPAPPEAPARCDATSRAPAPVAAGDGWLENELIRLDVNPDGTLELRDKRSGRRYPRCGWLEDAGDVGDEYTHAPPANDRVVTSRDARGVTVRPLHAGPLHAALEIQLELPLPARATPDRSERSAETIELPVVLRVTLEAGSARVGWTARVDNRARDHRLRVRCPTGAARVESARADSAFGIVERPARRPLPPAPAPETPVSSAPLQSFVDAGDAQAGVTLFSEGLMEYEVVAGADGGADLALTLLRCVGDLSRDDLPTRRGHAGPGLATPGAQCPGRFEFRVAFETRGAPPSASALYAAARAFLAPPRWVAPVGPLGEASPAKALPTRYSFLALEGAAGALLSACKRAQERDSLVVRLFNATGDETQLGLACAAPLAAAFRLDLLERRTDELPASGGRVLCRLPPHGILTLELVLSAPPSPESARRPSASAGSGRRARRRSSTE